MIRNVTELEVYNEALNLLPELYQSTKELPKNEFELINQLKRAAQSVPTNIAEGFGKRQFEKEFRRFLLIAIGSADEVISHLRTAKMLFPNSDIENLLNKYTILAKRLNALHKKWHHKPR